MLLLFSNSLVLVGIIILIGSLATVRKITHRLPLGSSRNSWYAMAALISLFVFGYLSYMIVFWNKHTGFVDLNQAKHGGRNQVETEAPND